MSGNKYSPTRIGCIQVEIIYRTIRTGPFYSALFLRQKWKSQVATIPINIRNNTKMKSHIHACFIVRVFTL